MNRFVSAAGTLTAAAAMVFGMFAPALAQQLPSYATPDTAPAAPPQRPSYAANEERISGRISAITGKYDLEIRDSRGFIDRVQLHDGTVINPTGLKLATGMSIQVSGINRGSTFEANQIDSRYTISPGYAAYGYPVYPGYVGYVGYPYYGPFVGIGIGIGWSGYYGGWHGYYGPWRGYYGWRGYRGRW